MNIYEPIKSKIIKTVDQSYDTRTFRLDTSKLDFKFEPGQFVEVSLPGLGEAPFGITSCPEETGYIDVAIRRVGTVTNQLHALKVGAPVWFRGPYGVGFPYEAMFGKDVLYIGGGTGLFPLRSSINHVLANKEKFGKVTVLYGARTPVDLMYKNEFESWKKQCNFLVTVDTPKTPDGKECGWNECVGVVTTLFDKLTYPIKGAIAMIAGPPIMYKFVIKKLRESGLADKQIYVSLERLMKCGVGKCQHCQINHKYCCLDGPVFNLPELGELPEAI
jgi:sulfhydrogenase subunit gamma (sulfur reductase)